MRRIAAVVFLALGLAAAPLAPAQAASRQVEHGRVTVPLPEYVGPARTVACGMLDATAGFVTGQSQGLFAYRFAVDPATRGLAYVLTPDAPADLDLHFWPGDAESHASKGAGGERGTVPAAARTATVCLDSGVPTAFTYTAG